ncbi:hypothetical protein TNCV_1319331 [Trichonephila clavipes]|nr:hypothetical protein TNCV_1319331 [Trichonephila clavipes]
MVNKLAKEGSNLSTPSTSALTYLELYSLKKSQNLMGWSAHHWYECNRPVLALALKCDREAPRLHSHFFPVVTSSVFRSQNTKRSPSVLIIRITRLLPST